jgi:hypothetical protein
MTIYLALGLATAVIGLVIGRTAVTVGERRSANPEHARRRRYLVLLAFMALGGALLIFDAIDTNRHRYVNLAVIAIMIGGVCLGQTRCRRG